MAIEEDRRLGDFQTAQKAFFIECVHKNDHSTQIKFTDWSDKEWRLSIRIPPRDYDGFVQTVNQLIDAKRAEIVAATRRGTKSL